jgi:TolA-binding protein
MLLGALVGAPLQCGSGEQNAPHEDSAGDALYALAQDFRAKGNDKAAEETLRFLVKHYPSNRHVPAVRSELGEGSEPVATPPSSAR